MPEDETLTEDDQQKQEDHLKVLRKKAKDHDDVVAERDAAKRELALLRAGIPDNPLGKLFTKGYDGDWSDVDAIKAAAIEYGIIAPPEEAIPATEKAAHERVASASAGAEAHPERDFDAELAAAETPEEFDRIYATSGRPMKR